MTLKPRGIKRKLTRIKRMALFAHKPRKIAKQGKSPVSVVKRAIQAKIRLLAIERDKTCVISQHKEDLPPNWYVCGPEKKDGTPILQAEHLCGRTKSKCYADMDNIVLLCMRHHFYFKTQRSALYWEIIRKHIGEERWAKVQAWEKDNAVYVYTAKMWRDKLNAL